MFNFAVELDEYMRDVVYRCLFNLSCPTDHSPLTAPGAVLTVMKDVMYPIERCLDFDSAVIPRFTYLIQDEAYVHSLLLVAYSYFDILRRRRPGNRAVMHMGKTINSLRHNLEKDDLATADSTLFVVLALALIADFSGDSEAAKNHMDGLSKMLKLRGGLSSLGYNATLQIKCCRYVEQCCCVNPALLTRIW